MQSARGLLALGLSLLLLPSCGDEAGHAPLGGNDGSNLPAGGTAGAGTAGAKPALGGASSGGSGGSGSGGSTGGTAAQSGASSIGVVDCEDLKDDTGWQLMVEIKNEMSQTLYLGPENMSCDASALFQVENGSRTVLPALASCRSSCQAAMAGAPVTCPLVCPVPTTVTLEPGQSVRLPWDGRFAVPQALPQQCVSGATAAPSDCVSARQVEAGVFTFSARAGTARHCLDPAGSCSCGPSVTGGCATPTSLIAGTIITTELFLMLEPGEPSPGGAPPLVGLSFRNQSE